MSGSPPVWGAHSDRLTLDLIGVDRWIMDIDHASQPFGIQRLKRRALPVRDFLTRVVEGNLRRVHA